ncbi:MAG TPA: flagellar motor stator protein MotA [Bdellovibrionales bacterium]|nr:flagellar motor stator protein MotA [Bdellovibrionales bacterium]
MLGLVGIVIVIVGVFGGFVLAGGHLHLIWQPYEIMIIFGAAIGGLIIGNPPSTIKAVIKGAIRAVTTGGSRKKEYVELLQMLFRFFQIYRRDGPQAVEKHVENPKDSELFKAYPSFLKNHHAVEFLCDTMKVVLSSDLSQYDLDDLLDQDIKAMHEEEHAAAHAVQSMADAMPGLGIVAAVLGVVHTMGLLDQGTQVIGHSVAAALIGTFLGVLSCYGFIGPISTKMAKDIEAEGRYLAVIKAALVALQRGNPPLVCVEYARRSIFPEDRPTFEETDKATKEKKAA